MKFISNSSRLMMLVVLLAFLGTSCNSRKKQAELAAAEKAKMEQEAKLKQQKADEEKRAEQAAAEAKMRQEAEAAATARKAKESTPAVRLNQYFDAISAASNTSSANSSINEALSMFESADTPVLIIISQEGSDKDYDKPTTIKSYLNYLKDQKKNINKIESLEFNSAGKINALELKK